MHSGVTIFVKRSLFALDNLVESDHLSCFVRRDQNNDLGEHISLQECKDICGFVWVELLVIRNMELVDAHKAMFSIKLVYISECLTIFLHLFLSFRPAILGL